MNYEILTDIPIPKNHGNSKYPFHDMEVGNSFAISSENTHKAVNASAAFARKHGGKFAVKKADDGSGVFCWRIE